MASLSALAPRPPRVIGIDIARGIASILMVQGHAFDAWASESAKASPWFAVELLFLQTLALPAFLVLSGASLAFRVEAAVVRGQSASFVRRAVIRRALSIVGVGYALNAVSALLDGWDGPQTWLRADVLHVIGLSLAVLALALRGQKNSGDAIDVSNWVRACWALAILPIIACPWVSRLSHDVEGPIGFVLGLFVDVSGITRMPLVPLVSWAAMGVVVGRAMIERNRLVRSIAGAPSRTLFVMLLGAIAIAMIGTLAQNEIAQRLGGVFDRRHVAVMANAVQLAARGIGVVAFGALFALWIPERARKALVILGRGSLWAYVFHIPLCYGHVARWAGLQNALSLGECAIAASVLVLLSVGAAFGKHLSRSRATPDVSIR